MNRATTWRVDRHDHPGGPSYVISTKVRAGWRRTRWQPVGAERRLHTVLGAYARQIVKQCPCGLCN